MSKSTKLGDVYCIRSQKLNKWCSYQVIEEKDDDIALLTLDWFSDNLPSESDLIDMKPLLLERFGRSGEVNTFYTSYKGVPNRFTYVGNIKPLIFQDIRSYASDWPCSYFDVEEEYLWKQCTKEEREKYINSKRSNKMVTIHGKKVEERISYVFLADTFFTTRKAGTDYNEVENFSNWSKLDKLGALEQIYYEGSNSSVLSYIANRRFIKTLKWLKHGKKEINISDTNISDTNIENLTIDVDGLEKLVLNDDLKTLFFYSSRDDLFNLNIKQNNQGLNLSITMNLTSEQIPKFELSNLSRLSLWKKDVDAEQIVEYYPNLESLCIWGGPGNIHNIAALGRLKKLRWLQLKDLFGFTINEFPMRQELKSIETLFLTSIPATVGKAIKKEYKDCLNVIIRQLRSEKWLEENLDNPFRDWQGREGIPKKQANAAFNAYKKTLSKLSKISSEEVEMEMTKVILKEFISVFNEMQYIDTVEREEIADSFFMILRKLGCDALDNLYMTWFDEWRDF